MSTNTTVQRRIGAAVTAGSFLALAGCAGADGGSGASGDEVTIGMLQPLSGALSAYGEETEAGFEFVVDQINADGGIESLDGATIELEVADEASDPAKATSEARRLIGSENVSLLVGTLLTSQMAAVSPVADRFQVPVLSLYAGGSNSDYLYSLGNPYGAGYAETLTEFISYLNDTADAGIETAALASSNYEAGQQVDQGLEERLPAIGVEIVGQVPLETGGSDYRPAVTRLESLAPDVVAGLVTTEDGITLHRARAAVGSELLYMGGTGGYADQNVWDSLGDDVARETLARNAFAMATFSSNNDLPSLQQLLTDAEAADLGIPIGEHFVKGAQAAWIVKALLEEAGSTDPQDLLDAFATIEIPADSDQLYLARPGGITFDPETRFMEDPTAIIVQWNPDGTQSVVWPEEFAEHEPELDR